TQFALALFFISGQASDIGDPWLRRPVPDLALWHELVALPQDADAQRIERRPAGAAKSLDPRIAALGGRLNVSARLAGNLQRRARHSDRDAERGAGRSLAIGAMAQIGVIRIGFGFDPDRAAGASAVHFHVDSLDCSFVSSMAAMSPSERPK